MSIWETIIYGLAVVTCIIVGFIVISAMLSLIVRVCVRAGYEEKLRHLQRMLSMTDGRKPEVTTKERNENE